MLFVFGKQILTQKCFKSILGDPLNCHKQLREFTRFHEEKQKLGDFRSFESGGNPVSI